MDTAEALKKAMKALRDAEIPESLWETALPLALADIRGGMPGPVDAAVQPPGEAVEGSTSRLAKSASGKTTRRTATAARPTPVTDEPSILASLPAEDTVFKNIENETGVSVADLRDLFHLEGGRVQLKSASRHLGANGKAATMTIAALLAGLVFAGTESRKLPFREINDFCKAKKVFHDKNSSTYIKATPGFAAVGTGQTQYLTTKTGWQAEFVKAAERALDRPVSS